MDDPALSPRQSRQPHPPGQVHINEQKSNPAAKSKAPPTGANAYGTWCRSVEWDLVVASVIGPRRSDTCCPSRSSMEGVKLLETILGQTRVLDPEPKVPNLR